MLKAPKKGVQWEKLAFGFSDRQALFSRLQKDQELDELVAPLFRRRK